MESHRKTKGRDYNLERIRILSFLFVITIHVTNYFCRAYGGIPVGEYYFSLILDTLARVSVPCFFMITGALLLGRDEPLEKHAKRLLRFFLVLVVWSAVYYLWNTFYMDTPCNLWEVLYVPTEPHLWYLYAMIPIYLVLPFLQVMCRHMGIKLEYAFLAVISISTVFNFVSSLIHEEAYYDLPLIGDKVYMFYVFIGYYIYKYRRHIRWSQGTAFLTFLICFAAAFGLTAGMTQWRGEHYERILEYGCPFLVLGAAAFFLWMVRCGGGNFHPGEKQKKWIDRLCSCSFGIYLIHILFLDTYKKFVEPEQVSAYLAVPGLIAGLMVLSFLSIFLLRRTSWGRRIT